MRLGRHIITCLTAYQCLTVPIDRQVVRNRLGKSWGISGPLARSAQEPYTNLLSSRPAGRWCHSCLRVDTEHPENVQLLSHAAEAAACTLAHMWCVLLHPNPARLTVRAVNAPRWSVARRPGTPRPVEATLGLL